MEVGGTTGALGMYLFSAVPCPTLLAAIADLDVDMTTFLFLLLPSPGEFAYESSTDHQDVHGPWVFASRNRWPAGSQRPEQHGVAGPYSKLLFEQTALLFKIVQHPAQPLGRPILRPLMLHLCIDRPDYGVHIAARLR